MKNQKGITLISLTIYIIALTVIIAMLSLISTFFYKNVKDSQNDIEPLTEFTNFNSYFSTDADIMSDSDLAGRQKVENLVKKVTVTVSYNFRNQTKSVELSTIVTANF